MAPLQENGNLQNEQAIQNYIQMYIDHHYTEEMYRDQSLEIFRVLNGIYPIAHPEVSVRLLNSYRAVIGMYARQIPLFELEGFGI